MKQPVVFIFLATYNRKHLIGETLDSIINQTYQNWKCVIIDDNSTDGTEEFLKENYLEKDDRFSFYKKDLSKYLKGLADTRNMSLDLASELNVEYLQFFDDDDIMHPQKLELQMEPFTFQSNLDMTLCKYRKFHITKTIEFNLIKAEDNSSNIISNDLFMDFYRNKISLNSLGPIWKFQKIKNFRFDKDLVTGEERDFYLRIFLNKEINYYPINKILFWYRKHERTVTSGAYYTKEEYRKSLKKIKNKIIVKILLSNRVSMIQKIKFLASYLKV